MGVKLVRIATLAGLFALGAAVIVPFRSALPAWAGDLVAPLCFLVLLSALGALYRHWYPKAERERPPVDLRAPRPTARSARRTLVFTFFWTVMGVLMAFGAGVVTVYLFRSDLDASTPDGMPLWLLAACLLVLTPVLAGFALLAVLQASRLPGAVRRIASGQEPRWPATVLGEGWNNLALQVRADGAGQPRVVRINSLSGLEEVAAGDDLVLDGALRPGSWVAVTGPGFKRVRWVGVCYRQPRAGDRVEVPAG